MCRPASCPPYPVNQPARALRASISRLLAHTLAGQSFGHHTLASTLLRVQRDSFAHTQAGALCITRTCTYHICTSTRGIAKQRVPHMHTTDEHDKAHSVHASFATCTLFSTTHVQDTWAMRNRCVSIRSLPVDGTFCAVPREEERGAAFLLTSPLVHTSHYVMSPLAPLRSTACCVLRPLTTVSWLILLT